MDNFKIILFLVLSLGLKSCGFMENDLEKEEEMEEIDCSVVGYGASKNELRLSKGLYPILDNYESGESKDGSLKYYTNPEYVDDDSKNQKPMHESKRIDCFEGEITEEDFYYGRFGFVTLNPDGREYPPIHTYEHIRVVYNYTLDELEVSLSSSKDPENIDGEYSEFFESVEHLDSILNEWGIERKL